MVRSHFHATHDIYMYNVLTHDCGSSPLMLGRTKSPASATTSDSVVYMGLSGCQLHLCFLCQSSLQPPVNPVAHCITFELAY